MKRILILALAMFVLTTGAAAHAGDLEISETVIDYGTIKEGPAVIKKLILSNHGISTMDIANVKAN